MEFETLTLVHEDLCAEIVPARGAIVSRLSVRGTEVLYMDRATLADLSKNVRGGIPILFPFAGKLDDDKLLSTGTTIKQHGFGRNMAWAVDEQSFAGARLSLKSDADTRALFPFDFSAEYSLFLLPFGLQIELAIVNTGKTAMPIAPGWHPYFNCVGPLKNQVRGDVPGFSGDVLGNDAEFNFGLLAPPSGRARFEIPGLGKLRESYCPEMRHLQFWSLPGKDFICIEPFCGPNNTINTAQRLEIQPGERRVLWMRIEII
jgi:galactose mutarotase-like enzyme